VHAGVEDLRRYVALGSVTLILTDPPYHRDKGRLYGALAHVATQVLQPGGSLLAMCGQSYLPDVLALMTPHLHYQWLFAARLSGPGHRRVTGEWSALVPIKQFCQLLGFPATPRHSPDAVTITGQV
jgi:hypothetical protein